MARVSVQSSVTISYLSHDAWSETYIGVRRIAYEILPDPPKRQTAEDGALCKLALVGSNHLMEVALFKLLRQYVEDPPASSGLTEAKLLEAGYFKMLDEWFPAVVGYPVQVNDEPFVSTERLRDRRNDTVHKTSALATVQMARSALFSAVEATKALYTLAGRPFPYAAHIAKYPLLVEPPFSTIPFPPSR